MLKRFFITGTDTSVGKTVVSRALLQALASGGKSVAGYKPVAKGSKETPEGLRNKDALVLQSVSVIRSRIASTSSCPYCSASLWYSMFSFTSSLISHLSICRTAML